jgi:DNA-binding PadR family transcriptional regulator
MSVEPNPEAFLPLTPAAFHILLVLATGERHGYAIMHEIEHRTVGKMRPGAGAIYGTLKRLIGEQLIEATSERPVLARGEERRRYYRLTELGDRVVRAEALRLAKLVQLAADALR